VPPGGGVEWPDYSPSQIVCSCDGRSNASAPCDKVELTKVTLNKTGGYSISVQSVAGSETSGLVIEGHTQDFHIKPNP